MSMGTERVFENFQLHPHPSHLVCHAVCLRLCQESWLYKRIIQHSPNFSASQWEGMATTFEEARS